MRVFLFILLFPVIILSQNIEISWNQTFLSAESNSTAQFEASVINNDAEGVSIAVIRERIHEPEEWTSSFCVGVQCYNPTIDTVWFMAAPGRPVPVYLDIITGNNQDVAQYNVQFLIDGDSEPFHQQILKVSTNPLGIDDSKLTDGFRVEPNYPNPFNPVTTIPVSIKVPGAHNLYFDVFDMSGKSVYSKVIRISGPANLNITWNAVDNNHQPVPTGVYLYRIKINTERYFGKMILMK
ncbi:MAG: hypothetical protein Kow00108_12690 [Calditrichia bacterium]